MKKAFVALLGVLVLALSVSCGGGGGGGGGGGEYTGPAYTIHYHSYSGKYTNTAAVWAWQNKPSAEPGQEVVGRPDGYGYVYKVPVIEDATEIGIIFKTAGSWSAQTSTYTTAVLSDGTDEFWIIEEDVNVHTVAPSTAPKVLWAMADATNKINIKLIDYLTYDKTTRETDKTKFKLLDGAGAEIAGAISKVEYTGELPVTDPVSSGCEVISSNTQTHFVFDITKWGASGKVTSADTNIYVRGDFTGWDSKDTDATYKMTWHAAGTVNDLSGNPLPGHFGLTLPIAKAPVGGKFKFGKTSLGDAGWFPGGMGNDMTISLSEYKAREFCVVLSFDIMNLATKYQVKYAAIDPATVLHRGILDAHWLYTGSDLGCTYATTSSTFKVWSPYATSATLCIYDSATGGTPTEYTMSASMQKTFSYTVSGDMKGKYYVYKFTGHNGLRDMAEYTEGIIDPYAICVNGEKNRALIVNRNEVNTAADWASDTRPAFSGNPTDAVVYEISVRDFTIDPNTGVDAAAAGKYMGLAQTGTTHSEKTTGLDYLGELKTAGLTHVQIMPFYDWVNRAGGENAPAFENMTDKSDSYDWGYMPANFNSPEGWFASDPIGTARMIELKKMIKAIHVKGLRVIMDVVYNHTDTSVSSLNKIAPLYYFRTNGYNYLNGSGCGDEINSQYFMARKFVLDSCRFWVNEYHVDGFRFDLMGLLDKTTMANVATAIKAEEPGCIVYGEGWEMGALKKADQASKGNQKNQGFGAFNDNFRDAIRGSAGSKDEKGVIMGAVNADKTKAIIAGLKSSNENLDPNYGTADANIYSYFTATPGEAINYMSCHDNDTEWDRMVVTSTPSAAADKIKAAKLGMAFVMMAQGVPFFHAGSEFFRTKTPPADNYHNSNNNADGMNMMDWARRATYDADVSYYKNLLTLRKNHPMLRFTTWTAISANVTAAETAAGSNVFDYTVSKGTSTDAWSKIRVVFNCTAAAKNVTLTGTWYRVSDGSTFDLTGANTVTSPISVPAYTAYILRQ